MAKARPPSKIEKRRRALSRTHPAAAAALYIRKMKRVPARGGGFVLRLRHVSRAASAAARARDAAAPLRRWGVCKRLVQVGGV